MIIIYIPYENSRTPELQNSRTPELLDFEKRVLWVEKPDELNYLQGITLKKIDFGEIVVGMRNSMQNIPKLQADIDIPMNAFNSLYIPVNSDEKKSIMTNGLGGCTGIALIRENEEGNKNITIGHFSSFDETNKNYIESMFIQSAQGRNKDYWKKSKVIILQANQLGESPKISKYIQQKSNLLIINPNIEVIPYEVVLPSNYLKIETSNNNLLISTRDTGMNELNF